MDLCKTPNEEKVKLFRLYSCEGFVFLPFLWFVISVWFFREAFFKETFEGQAEVRKYVIRSCIGTIIWLGGLVAWVSIFQLNHASWEELGDRLSFLIPLGEA